MGPGKQPELQHAFLFFKFVMENSKYMRKQNPSDPPGSVEDCYPRAHGQFWSSLISTHFPLTSAILKQTPGFM